MHRFLKNITEREKKSLAENQNENIYMIEDVRSKGFFCK